MGRLDVLRRATWPTRGVSWASHGVRNGSSLSRICRSRWGYLQPLRAQAIHTGWTVSASSTDDATSTGDFLHGCHGVNSRLLPDDVGFVENTLKASLSKSMWDTRVTTGACSERDRGQFFMDVEMARRRTIDRTCEMTYCSDLIFTSGLSRSSGQWAVGVSRCMRDLVQRRWGGCAPPCGCARANPRENDLMG